MAAFDVPVVEALGVNTPSVTATEYALHNLTAELLGGNNPYARTASGLRTLSDTVGLNTPSVTATEYALHNLSAELLGLAEAVSTVKVTGGSSVSRSFSETLGIAQEALESEGLLDRLLSPDSVGLTNPYARLASLLRRVSDSLTLADDPNLVLLTSGALAITVAEMLGLRKANFHADGSVNRTLPAETLALARVYSRKADAARAFTEAVALLDEFRRAGQLTPVPVIIHHLQQQGMT